MNVKAMHKAKSQHQTPMGPPPVGIVIRPAVIEDNRNFNLLIKSLGGPNLFKALFGQYNFTSLIEYAYVSMVAINENEECVGFVCFNDGIITWSDEGPSFDELIESLQQTVPCQASNSIFLNFWALDADENVGAELLFRVFDICSDTNYLFWISSSTSIPPPFIGNHFTRIACENLKTNLVYMMHRSKILPQLQVREARVEDNDDLLPILQNSYPNIPLDNHNYFLADLIHSNDERSKFFVGINKNRPVGMLATSLEINAELLYNVFDLQEYPGLILAPDEPIIDQMFTVVVVGEIQMIQELSIRGLTTLADVEIIDACTLKSENENLKNPTKLLNKICLVLDECAAGLKSQGTKCCVVVNFPSNEQEARSLMTYQKSGKLNVNAIIEIQNLNADENDIENEEDLMGEVLDGIELLREQYVLSNSSIVWKKFVYDNGSDGAVSFLELVNSEIRSLLVDNAKRQLNAREKQKRQLMANAFAISLFCMDERFASRSVDLISVAFEEYSNIDYCILMIPNAVIPSTAILRTMSLPRIRAGVSFDQALYLVHRSYLSKEYVSVKRLTESHIPSVIQFLQSAADAALIPEVIDAQKRILQENDIDLFNNPAEVSFIIMNREELIGLVNLSRKNVTSEDINELKIQYNLEEHVSFERHRGRSQAKITFWTLNSLFSKATRYILGILLRLYKKSLFYYHAYNNERIPRDLLEELKPVGLRRSSTRKTPEVDSFEGRPLYFILKKDIVNIKKTVSKRLVVVGSTTVALSLLEQLCLDEHTNYWNVYIVAETFYDDSIISNSLRVLDVSDYTHNEIKALGMHNKVTWIKGRLTDIDRKNKAIVVCDEVIVEYDILFICPPCQDISYQSFPTISSWHPMMSAERGIFCCGNHGIEETAKSFLEEVCKNNLASNIVVAGDGIRALHLLGYLCTTGISKNKIIWITSNVDFEMFVDDDIRSTVLNKFLECGIEVFPDSKILDVRISKTSVDAVYVRKNPPKNSIMGPKEECIECCALFCCSTEQCDIDTFRAINDCGLVYDGGVVVDASFKTCDECIYAAGEFTKFSRRYPDSINHSRCNQREIGEMISKDVKEKCINDKHKSRRINESFSASGQLISRFFMERTRVAIFPGNLVFISSTLPNESVLSPTVLQTGPSEDYDNRIIILKFNGLGVLVEVSCLMKLNDWFMNMAKFLSTFVGWHESFLNSAIYAYEVGNVNDWYEFLHMPWSQALCFDKFPALCEVIALSINSDKGMITLLEKVFENADSTDDDDVIAAARRNIIGERGASVPQVTKNIIIQHVVDFLRKNKSSFPLYYIPLGKSLKK